MAVACAKCERAAARSSTEAAIPRPAMRSTASKISSELAINAMR